MIKVIFNFLFYLLALYGAYTVISNALHLSWDTCICKDKKIKTVLIVKDAGEVIEGIIRSIFSERAGKNNVHTCRLTIVDMDSSDDTPRVLHRLEQEYEGMNVLDKNEKDLVFMDFSHQANL